MVTVTLCILFFLSAMHKLFSSKQKRRSWAEANSIIFDEQNGLRKQKTYHRSLCIYPLFINKEMHDNDTMEVRDNVSRALAKRGLMHCHDLLYLAQH